MAGERNRRLVNHKDKDFSRDYGDTYQPLVMNTNQAAAMDSNNPNAISDSELASYARYL